MNISSIIQLNYAILDFLLFQRKMDDTVIFSYYSYKFLISFSKGKVNLLKDSVGSVDKLGGSDKLRYLTKKQSSTFLLLSLSI